MIGKGENEGRVKVTWQDGHLLQKGDIFISQKTIFLENCPLFYTSTRETPGIGTGVLSNSKIQVSSSRTSCITRLEVLSLVPEPVSTLQTESLKNDEKTIFNFDLNWYIQVKCHTENLQFILRSIVIRIIKF